MKKRIFIPILMAILLMAFASPALAQGPDGAKVIFGDNFTLEEGKTLNDDLVLFGGNVTLKKGSTVSGDLVVFGGNVNVNGTVEGDIGAIGGNVHLEESSLIKGDIGALGGNVNIAEGAVIKGEVQSVTEIDYDYGKGHFQRDNSSDTNTDGNNDNDDDTAIAGSSSSSHRDGFSFNPFQWIGGIISDILSTISFLIVMGLITWLVAAFMPEQMVNVRNTLTEAAPLSFGVGVLSSIVGGVSFLLILTICLAFVPLIATSVLTFAALFGWIVIGQIIGERLLTTNGRAYPGFIISSIFGVLFLTLLVKMPVIGLIECIQFIGCVLGLLIATTGMGAVLLTRFGTRPYPAAPASAYGAAPSPSRPSRSSSPSYSGGPRVRWTEAAPDVSEDDVSASEKELNDRIKAALAEADGPDSETPDDEAKNKPKKKKPAPKKPDDEPDLEA